MSGRKEIINHRVSKIQEWVWGDVYEWYKFLNKLLFTDKIIELIFFQLTLNLIQITQTQEIINHSISKIHEWI